MSVMGKVGFTLAAEALIFSALLFGPAATVRWPAGCADLIIFFLAAVWITLRLVRHDPALLAGKRGDYKEKAGL